MARSHRGIDGFERLTVQSKGIHEYVSYGLAEW